jgi:hypothetical protein
VAKGLGALVCVYSLDSQKSISMQELKEKYTVLNLSQGFLEFVNIFDNVEDAKEYIRKDNGQRILVINVVYEVE